MPKLKLVRSGARRQEGASNALISEAEVAVPISAFIITKNEEARLPRTLAALQPWVDEIVVVDSGSTDATVALARSMGAIVHHREWSGYGGQKHFAEQQCRNDWVLNVDADEVVTSGLASEICSLFRSGTSPEPGAFLVRILTVYPGDARPRSLVAADYNVVRLYNRTVAAYRDHPVFDRVIVENVWPRQLSHPIFHHPYTSFTHLISKVNEFSSFRSRQNTRPRRYLRGRLFVEFPASFMKFYVVRRHITGGWKGFYFSLCNAFMRTTRIAKMLEAQFAESQDEQRRVDKSKKMLSPSSDQS